MKIICPPCARCSSVESDAVRTRVILVALLAAASAALAGEPPVLEVIAPEAAVSVGDRVPVRVMARGGEDLMWGELEVGEDAETSWEVVDGPHELAGARPPAWELLLAPMEVGEITLPAFNAVVRDAGGERHEVFAADRRSVNVVSVLPPDEDVQPAALRDPLGVSGFPWEWVLPAAAPALALALALTWWGRRRKRRVKGPLAPPPVPFDELEAVLAELERRVGREPAEGVCDRLAVGLRHYLERRCGQPAEEMTSFELRLLTRKLGWPDSIQRGIQSVMGTADRVRFGRFPTNEDELRRAIAAARDTAAALEEHLQPDHEEGAIEEAAG
jgi:hypothetical protein